MVVKSNIRTIALSTITKNYLSSIQTRDVTEQEFQYDYMPQLHGMKKEMQFNLDPLITRPFNYDTFTWSTTNARYSTIISKTLLSDLFMANTALSNALRSYAFFRAHACIYVSLTGTLSHQGNILVGVLPGTSTSYNATTTPQPQYINSLLTAPHAMLGANEATSACIEVPFYVPTDLLTFDNNNNTPIEDLGLVGYNSYATLMAMVMNPLAVGEGSSTSISIHVQVHITKLEVYVPVPTSTQSFGPLPTVDGQSFTGQVVSSLLDTTSLVAKTVTFDFIDTLRGAVRSLTGLHNPNQPVLQNSNLMQTRNRSNIVDDVVHYEKMDPYSKFTRVTKDGIFHSKKDEMNIGHIISKPQYIGSFQVASTYTAGRLLKVGVINPYQFNAFGGYGFTSNIERMYYNTYAWSGDMELIIQSSMTNKHSVKLVVAKMYGLDRRVINGVPLYDSSKISPSSLLEFSAGNQQQVVSLDFLSRNQVLQNTMDPTAAALQHGLYYIYLVQPLVYADGVPTTVEFNLFLRCKPNFRFHGYSSRGGRTTIQPTKFVPQQITEDDALPELEGQSASNCDPVMNAPNTCSPLCDQPVETEERDQIERIKPILSMRDLIRRPLLTYYNIYNPGTSGIFNLAIPVANLLGYGPFATNQDIVHNVFRMYYGYNGGVKLKIKIDMANAVIRYNPPTFVNSSTDYLVQSVQFNPSSVLQNASDDNFVDSRTFVELPHSISPNISDGKSYCVYDLHIPQPTIYNWLGGLDWFTSSATSNSNVRTKLGSLGWITISGRVGVDPGTRIRTWIFAGADDEGRLGFHTMAPYCGLPVTSTSGDPQLYSFDAVPNATYTPISLKPSSFLNYTSLSTIYETAPS